MSLDGITKSIEGRLADFAGLNARVQFDMGEDGVISIDGTTNPPTLGHEAIEADCTIRLSAADMEKMIEGVLNPMMAYTLGTLKVDGSMGIAMKVAGLLED